MKEEGGGGGVNLTPQDKTTHKKSSLIRVKQYMDLCEKRKLS